MDTRRRSARHRRDQLQNQHNYTEIDFSIIKNLPGNSTVGNFGHRADGQLGADGQLHIIFEQVQNRFHWDKALGGRLFCHLGKTVTPYSLPLNDASGRRSTSNGASHTPKAAGPSPASKGGVAWDATYEASSCLLYTSPSPRDKRQSRMPSSA